MIRRVTRGLVSFLIRASGIPWIIREIICKNKTTIILYHDPKPQVLKNHLEYLSKHYSFISLTTLVDAIHQKDWSKIPRKSLVITVDDGYAGNYELVPILKAYGVIATIYVCSGIVGTNRHFWFKEAAGRGRNLKSRKNEERLTTLQGEISFFPEKEYSYREALSREEIMDMAETVAIESHSKFHAILTTCKDDVCEEEICGSKADLEMLLGKSCEHFSYPNGDYSEREIQYIKECGYKSARTIDSGWNDVMSDPYRLRITGVSDDASITLLIAQLSGLPSYVRYLFKGSLRGRYPTIRPKEGSL